MKRRVSVHKSVGGVSRIALTVCLVVLVVVFVTAYNIGSSTANPHKQRLLQSNMKLLSAKKEDVAKCEARKQTYLNGEKISVTQVIDELELQKRAVEDGLRMEQERAASMRLLVQKCKEGIAELRKKAFGAPAENITAYMESLETKRLKLIEQYETLTDIKEVHRRKDLITLQQAIVQQLILLDAQAGPTGRVTACEASPAKYSVVFDIGSSGNRVHVYKYTVKPITGNGTIANAGNTTDGIIESLAVQTSTTAKPRDLISQITLKEELFKFNHRALSKLPNPVAEAPGALRELFDQAKAFVPAEMHFCTPVEFKATAGLRMLGVDKATEILSAIRREYRNETFWLRGSAPVRILDGSEEGPMAWLTVNFLLGAFEQGSGANTVAVIDLGGGSTQVVFEPHTDTFYQMPELHQFTAQLGGRTVRAYQHSYEGFGLHAATRELLYNLQGKRQPKPPKATQQRQTSTAPPTEDGGFLGNLFGDGHNPGDADGDDNNNVEQTKLTLPLDPTAVEAFPCFAVGYIDALGVSNTKMTKDGVPLTQPNFTACANLFRDRLLKPHDVPCPMAGHCGIGNTYQPPLTQFPGNIYAFSFIFDLLEAANATALAVSSEKFVARLSDLQEIGTRRCADLTLDRIRAAELRGSLQPAYDCMYYAYVYTLLRDGYGIADDRQLHVAKKINAFETAWTLGASLISLA